MKSKKFCVALSVLLSVIIILAAIGLYNALKVQYYTVESEKISTPIRAALITDFHSSTYGRNASILINQIDLAHPDVIFLVGDIFDESLDDENAEALLADIGERYMCYYVTGNHEYRSDVQTYKNRMKFIRNCGITRLSGASVNVKINGETVNICGLNDPDSYALAAAGDQKLVKTYFLDQLERAARGIDNDGFTVLLSHHPEYFPEYSQYEFDLVLSGHTHGGQVRIPGILDGLYAPDQGFFPEYCGGVYQNAGMTMIISRGLDRHLLSVPRFYNRNELVIVDII